MKTSPRGRSGSSSANQSRRRKSSLRDGTFVDRLETKNTTAARIAELMIGRQVEKLVDDMDEDNRKISDDDIMLSLKNFYVDMPGEKVKGIDLNLRRGEILGLAGLDSSGRTETLESIFGIRTRKSGTITLGGKPCRNRNSGESLKNGFAMLTEERRATGIFGIRSIRDNTVISSLHRHKKFGPLLSEKSQREDTQHYIDAMRTKTPSQETQIRSLSGGNQQKVIIGRWLLTEPEVLLLDEPTRGIDVGAKYEIYQLIGNLANEGKTVLMVSSEMPELLGVCDRILVMSGGRLAGEVDAKNTTQEEIMTLAAKFA